MDGAHDAPDPPQAPLQVQLPAVPQLQVHLQVEAQEKEELKFQTQRKEEWKNVEAYRARSTADKGQIFQILGFYVVFQGVVVNTVCTSTKLECGSSFFLVVLSALVSIGTTFSVSYKFTDYMKNNKKLLRSEMFFEIAKARILHSTNDEEFQKANDKLQSIKAKKIIKDEHTRRKFRLAVMLFLAFFSIIILLCCIIVRCVK